MSAAFHLLTVAIAAARLDPEPPLANPGFLPPVSIVIPVCGLDNFTEETLGSAFLLDYPEYELLFCAARRDDPAVRIVQHLIACHSDISARLLVGDDRITNNPKLNNVIKGWDAARHAWIAVADCNVLMPADYLLRLVSRWQEDTGAVCSMPIGTRPHNFWSELECAFLNTLQARYQYVSEALGFGFAQGKTMFFHRDLVERAGGIRALAAEDAEDAAATKIVRHAGLQVHLVDMPLQQPLGWRSAREVWARQVRWARLRRISFPLLFAPEIAVGGAFPAVAAGFVAFSWGWSVPATLGGFLLVWFGAEALIALRAGWHLSARSAAALLLRDVLLPALWVSAVMGRSFTWRGNPMVAGKKERRPLAGPRWRLPIREIGGRFRLSRSLRSQT